MADKLEKLVAAKLLLPTEATDPVVINVVNYLTDQEVDQLIAILLKAAAFNDGECPPPLNFRTSTLRQRARDSKKKKKK